MDDPRMTDRTKMPHSNAVWSEAYLRWEIPEAKTEALERVADRSLDSAAHHRALTDDERTAIAGVNGEGQQFISAIRALCPAGRETSLAVTNAEQAVMWAVKALTA